MMMICSRCKKRPAVVFVQRSDGGEIKNQGYCLSCARALNIPQVEAMMKQMGLTDETLANMDAKMDEMLANGDMEEMMKSMGGLLPLMNNNGENEEEEDFSAGGSPAMPFVMGKEEPEADEKAPKGRAPRDRRHKFLDTYCENLTKKAAEGRLDRVVGRDREIYRAIQILCRRQKNNPCLIGEAGVGKTAIAEGIAQRIAAGQVPARLQNREIYLLDLTALVAGTQFRGQFEARVKGLINEVRALGNVILFIDEVHNITGAGESEGAMNAGNILKPALSRGELQVIGATTFTEYRKYIEKDQALERRFQPVKVEEPSIADTITMLQGIKSYYEQHHGVKVSDAVVRQTVSMSERYINDRFLPDKAIDLLDEACACCSLRHPEITEYQNAVRQLDEVKARIEAAEQEEEIDYEQLANLKYQEARQEEALPALQAAVENIPVEAEDLSRVIELWTGIPARKVQESEYQKINGLEAALKEKIIGQDEAVELVAAAIKRSRAGITSRRRPASFIFVGPTGVGKTELVKQLAAQLFDSADPLIRLDMSEFMEKYAVSRLIGSPPGYVGYDEAGQLTEKVRRRPYSVVLFDEIEKAHPDVLNILLQILDEGRITDAQGRTVNFENTVIAMTSNAGSTDKTGETGFNKTVEQMSRNKALRALNDFLRPEFLSRVDEIICFKPLGPAELRRIAALMLQEYRAPLQEKGLDMDWTQEALDALCEKAQGGKYGARDLRRVIRKEVEDAAADLIVSGEAQGVLHVDAAEGKITVHCD